MSSPEGTPSNGVTNSDQNQINANISPPVAQVVPPIRSKERFRNKIIGMLTNSTQKVDQRVKELENVFHELIAMKTSGNPTTWLDTITKFNDFLLELYQYTNRKRKMRASVKANHKKYMKRKKEKERKEKEEKKKLQNHQNSADKSDASKSPEDNAKIVTDAPKIQLDVVETKEKLDEDEENAQNQEDSSESDGEEEQEETPKPKPKEKVEKVEKKPEEGKEKDKSVQKSQEKAKNNQPQQAAQQELAFLTPEMKKDVEDAILAADCSIFVTAPYNLLFFRIDLIAAIVATENFTKPGSLLDYYSFLE